MFGPNVFVFCCFLIASIIHYGLLLKNNKYSLSHAVCGRNQFNGIDKNIPFVLLIDMLLFYDENLI